MNEDYINLSGLHKESIVDGPGIRYTIFTQGCPHNCLGCHNTQTHDFNLKNLVLIDDIISDINSNPLLKGITISGGEPFIQSKQLLNLINRIDKSKLDIIVYTGFNFEYLIENSNNSNNYIDVLKNTNVLIDGKFEIDKKSDLLSYRGSSNQRVINCKESLKEDNIILFEF